MTSSPNALTPEFTCSLLPVFPAPRRVVSCGTDVAPPIGGPIFCAPPDLPLVRRFFAAVGLAVDIRADSGLEPGQLRSAPGLGLPEPPPARGYSFRHAPGGFALRAADRDGLYAGLQTLWTLLDSAAALPSCEFVDWPVVAARGFQLDLGRQPETPAEIRRLLCQQARYHYNECWLYLENSLQLPCLGDAADPRGLSLTDYAAVQEFGRDVGIDVIPSLNLLGHMEKILRHPRFAHLAETAQGLRHPRQGGCGDVCPELPESRELVRRMIRETAAASQSHKLMVGLDENWTLGSHPHTRKRLDAAGGAGAVFREWIEMLHAETRAAGKQMWMWEDMLYYHDGAKDRIPADIGMCEWHYQHIEEYPSYSFRSWRRIDALRELRGHGHPAILCCGMDPDHLLSMLRYAEGRGLDGLMVVQWAGGGAVQEVNHVGRALSGAVLWAGDMPSFADAARALTRAAPDQARRIGRGLAQATYLPHPRADGSDTCPRFWSWPEILPAIVLAESTIDALAEDTSGCEAIDACRFFIEARCVSYVCDWARETAALAGRTLLQTGGRESASLDQAIRRLEAATAAAERLAAGAGELVRRYAAGQKERHMEGGFKKAASVSAGLLARLKVFRDNPCEATWPFARVSLHVDGLVVDPCSHNLRVLVDDAGGTGRQVYSGGVHLPPTLEGEFVMSFPLERMPTRVRVEVGGFAAVALTRVRIESLDGTRLPVRLVDHGGYCVNPEHLLEFDRKMTMFNPPDVMTEWRSFDPPTVNHVTLDFEGSQPI